jgi:hypothetical protein
MAPATPRRRPSRESPPAVLTAATVHAFLAPPPNRKVPDNLRAHYDRTYFT